MKAFRVKGAYSPKGKKWFKFSKDIVAENDVNAKEIAYSLLGSKYGIKRRLIKIDEIAEIAPSESEDPTVQHLLGE